MKKLITAVLLLSITAQTFGRTAVLAHFYIFRKQIAEKECVNSNTKIKEVTVCYGSCVLEKRLEERKEEEKNSRLPDLLKSLKESVIFQSYPTLLAGEAEQEATLLAYPEPAPVKTTRFSPAIFHPPAM